MPLELWLAFVVASTIILIIPGPTILLVVSYALGQGRRVALAMVLGVAAGDLVAMTVSLAGLGVVLAASATLFTILKWVGAVYLVWLGWKLWRAEPKLPAVDAPKTDDATAVDARAVGWHAFVVTALNPKSIAFFVAFVPHFIVPGAAPLPQMAVLIATFVTLAAVNALAYALLADQARRRIRRRSVLRGLNRAGAACLVCMGVATAALRRA